MKNTSTARPRTLALLLAATVLPATPVFAQEAVAPPPVTATTPQPEAPAAPPAAATPAPAPAPVFAPRAEVVQPLPVRPAPAPEAVTADPAPRATVTRDARPAPRPRAVAAAPVAAAPVAAPVAVTPAPVPTPETIPEPAAPVASTSPEQLPVTSDTAQASTTTTTTQTPWMWIVGGLVALGAIIALLFARRRRPVDKVVYEEPVYVAPGVVNAPVIDPVLAAPVYTPPVAPTPIQTAVTPVADDERPWIGLSLQATGSNARGEEDLVEYNLIVENAGEVMAHDVRVSTFLIDGRTKSSETETSLIDAVGETQSRFIDLAPGTSVPIASTLSVPHGVDPCIIAEAHYPLPGGGEGHIAARFVIENGKGDAVEARLDDVLERV